MLEIVLTPEMLGPPKIWGPRLKPVGKSAPECQHSTVFSSAYATLQTDTEKFEEIQLRFKFLIASAQPIF